MYLLFCSNNKMSHIQQFYEMPSVTHGFSHGLKIARPRRIEMGSNPPPPQIKNADIRLDICISWQRMRDSNSVMSIH